MGSLIEATTRAVPEEVFRLKSVELHTLTAEQLAKSRVKFADAKAHVDLKITWEPLSYHKTINGEAVPEEVDYIRLTKGEGLSGLDGVSEADAADRVNRGGFPAIPAKIRINLPRNIVKADVDEQPQPYLRFMVAAVKAGLHIDIDEDGTKTGKPGSVFSTDAGKVFKCRSGYEEFPTPGTKPDGKFFWNWDERNPRFMRLPVAQLTDYVQPNDVPTRAYESADRTEQAVSSVPGGSNGVTVDALNGVSALLNLHGQSVAEVNANAIGLALAHVAEAPVLASREVMDAAGTGGFVEYLVAKGVVTVVDGVIQ